MKFWICVKCGGKNLLEKWATEDWHEDGTESYLCPSCGAIVHEREIKEADTAGPVRGEPFETCDDCGSKELRSHLHSFGEGTLRKLCDRCYERDHERDKS